MKIEILAETPAQIRYVAKVLAQLTDDALDNLRLVEFVTIDPENNTGSLGCSWDEFNKEHMQEVGRAWYKVPTLELAEIKKVEPV